MSKSLLIGCGALLVIGLIVGIAAIGSYNGLVAKDEAVSSAWSQVENVYQRRADLIPNLVETVKGTRDFEQQTLQAVVEARSRVGQLKLEGAPSPEELQQFEEAQAALSSSLSRLLVVVENYPELRSTEAFRDLMHQLEGAENRIAVERKRYNEAARELNTACRSFPTNMLTGLAGVSERPYFEAEIGSEKAPKVDF